MSEPAEPQYSDVVERFLRYVQVDTQGDPRNIDVVPSTACQQDLVNLLADELRAMGAQDVITTEHAYVTPGLEGLPTLALNAHVDAESSVPGNGVKPQVVDYQGGKLVMGVVDGVEVYTDPSINPELNDMVGRQIICTDGRTLLAADDKAGVAEIMALAKRLLDDPSIPHPRLAISFVPDEELGHGAALLDLDEHGATWGYTLDGGPIGVMNYECFNAAEAKVRFAGFSVHPGTSKDRMVNAVEIACQYENLMPPQAKPQYTEGYDGFIHLHDLRGGVESAEAWYIIRDHDSGRLEAKKEVMRQAAAFLNERYGREIVSIEINDQYRNMAEVVTQHPHLIENARKAYAANGYTMWTEPMRGGTDGAQLCYRGLPCANISAGYHNAHGVKEFVGVYELEDMVDVLQTLVGLYAEPQAE